MCPFNLYVRVIRLLTCSKDWVRPSVPVILDTLARKWSTRRIELGPARRIVHPSRGLGISVTLYVLIEVRMVSM